MQAADLSGAGAAPRPLRIAWSGESGQADVGGVRGIAYVLLRGLAERGHVIEVFGSSESDEMLSGLPSNVSVHSRPIRWHWGRWYTTGRLRMFLSYSLLRVLLQRRLADDILRHHEQAPFDVIFQMSQLESFFGRRRADLPLIVHPCTIARLEWEWHRAERELSADRGRSPKSRFVSLMLLVRAQLQKAHARRPDVVVGPSHVFLADLQRVFGLPAGRLAVLRHPVELSPPAAERHPAAEPAALLFISRMSSRKGVELVIALSHRLDDLVGRAHISLIGGATLWSDYSPLLDGLNPRIADYVGELPHDEVDAMLASAAMLLVPSRFEPGSIVTGEALGRGVPVVASTAVGPSDLLHGDAGRVFADGDLDALEAATRDLLKVVEADRERVAAAARSVAEGHLAADLVVQELERILRAAAT